MPLVKNNLKFWGKSPYKSIFIASNPYAMYQGAPWQTKQQLKINLIWNWLSLFPNPYKPRTFSNKIEQWFKKLASRIMFFFDSLCLWALTHTHKKNSIKARLSGCEVYGATNRACRMLLSTLLQTINSAYKSGSSKIGPIGWRKICSKIRSK